MGSNWARDFRSENVATAIAQFRSDGQVPILSKEQFTGGQCRVFKADFGDGESWAIRIPLYVQSPLQDDIVNVLKGEVGVLQELNAKGFPWAAQFRGSSLTFDNLVRYPFIVSSWVDGTPLAWSESELHPQRHLRDEVLSQIAQVQVALIECTLDEDRGTATQFFDRVMRNRFDRISSGTLPQLTEKDSMDQQTNLASSLFTELDHAPFAMDHGDIAPKNLIKDKDLNIVGQVPMTPRTSVLLTCRRVIDYGMAQKVPMQLAGGLPRILRLVSPDQPISTTLQADRKAYIVALRSLKTEHPLVVPWMLQIQASKDADYRACVLESVISKGMHVKMAQMKWRVPHGGLVGDQIQ